MEPHLKIKQVNPNSLKFAEYNPRCISDNEMKGLKSSIKEFGIVDPFIVNRKNNTIIGGHMRCKAAIEMNIKEVPIVYVELSPDKEKLLNIALNNPHAAGTFTPELSLILEDIEINSPELFTELNLEPLKLELGDNPPGKEGSGEDEPGNSEEWVNFAVGNKVGVVHKDVYDLFYSEWDRLSGIVESEEITPIIEAMIANSAGTPEESLI